MWSEWDVELHGGVCECVGGMNMCGGCEYVCVSVEVCEHRGGWRSGEKCTGKKSAGMCEDAGGGRSRIRMRDVSGEHNETGRGESCMHRGALTKP